MNKLKALGKQYDSMSNISKATIWFTLSSFFNTGVSMLTTPIVSRMISTSEYGVVSVYHTWESILTIVATLNLFCGIQEVCIAKNKEDENQVTGSLMTLSIGIVALVSLVFGVFHGTVSSLLNIDFKLLVIMMFDIGSVAIMQFWMTQKRFNYAYRTFTVVTILKCILRAIGGIIFIPLFPEHKVVARLLGLAIPDYLFAIPILIIILKKVDFKRITAYWKRGLKFNIVLIPHYLSGVLMSSSDRIMISNMIGDDKAGIYSMMYSCASIVSIFYGAASTAITPFFLSSIENENYEGLNKKVIQSILATVGCSIFAILVAPEVLRFFAPKEYYEGLILIPVLMFGSYLNFFYLLFSNFAFYYEKKYFITTATLVSAAINICLNYFCIPIFGYKVAAFTTIVGYTFLAVVNYFIYIKLAQRRIFDMKKILAIMLSFAACTVIAILLYPHFWIRAFFILMLVGLVFYKKDAIISTFR